MPAFETRVAPDGTISYRAKVRLKGAPQVSASFARKTEARKWAQDTESAIRDGRYFKAAPSKRRTLADAIRIRLRRNTHAIGAMAKSEIAKLRSDPSAMIAGWREIAKMCGYYAPERKQVQLRERRHDPFRAAA